MHGAEAIVTSCTFLNMPCVAKRRLPKIYRVKALDTALRRQRTKLEAKLLYRAKSTGVRCPLVLYVDLDKCEIVQSQMQGELLANYLHRASNAKLFEQAGAQLALLHAANISHGDSTTSNFMVDKERKVSLFDFGLAQFEPSLEAQALDLLLFEKSVSAKQFTFFLKGYCQKRGKAKTNSILRQLAEIKSRGRYVER